MKKVLTSLMPEATSFWHPLMPSLTEAEHLKNVIHAYFIASIVTTHNQAQGYPNNESFKIMLKAHFEYSGLQLKPSSNQAWVIMSVLVMFHLLEAKRNQAPTSITNLETEQNMNTVATKHD